MSIRDTIREFLNRDPFEPFRVVTSSGEAHVVANADLVVLLKSEAFIAQPDSDQRSYVPYLHVSTVETLPRQRNGRARRGKRSK